MHLLAEYSQSVSHGETCERNRKWHRNVTCWYAVSSCWLEWTDAAQIHAAVMVIALPSATAVHVTALMGSWLETALCVSTSTGMHSWIGTCPKGKAWADTAIGNDESHQLIECSNRGQCDRKTGQCICEDGFTGSSCSRRTCCEIDRLDAASEMSKCVLWSWRVSLDGVPCDTERSRCRKFREIRLQLGS